MSTDILVFTIGLVAVITGITQAAKAAGFPAVLAPLFEIALGVAFTDAGAASGALTISGLGPGAPTYFFASVYGVIAGLSAAGLYNNGRAAIDAVKSATS